MLTKKQHELLLYINKRLSEDGVSPSFDEMKEALNLASKSGVHRLVSALEERGFIRRLAHRARALEVLKLPSGGSDAQTPASRTNVVSADFGSSASEERSHGVEVPVLGRIAAGVPIEAIQHETDRMPVPADMISGGEHFALEVHGDSMIEAGINDGDVVVIRETTDAADGDIVVAQIEGYEATLKRLRRNGEMIVLEAANPAYESRMLPKGSVSVQGRLVGLIRTY